MGNITSYKNCLCGNKIEMKTFKDGKVIYYKDCLDCFSKKYSRCYYLDILNEQCKNKVAYEYGNSDLNIKKLICENHFKFIEKALKDFKYIIIKKFVER